MDDHALLSDFATGGKAEALGELVRRYEPLVHAAAMRQVVDVHLAQDITQSAMMTLVRKAGQIGPTTPVGPWLLRTTRYLVIDAMRGEKTRRHHERLAALERGCCSAASERASIEPIIDDALHSLRDGDRTILTLRYLQGWTFEQISEELNLNGETTRQRVSRALRRLRDVLSRRGVRMDDLVPAVLPFLAFGNGSDGNLLLEHLRALPRPTAHPMAKYLHVKTLAIVGSVVIVTGGVVATHAALRRNASAITQPTPPPELVNSRPMSTIP